MYSLLHIQWVINVFKHYFTCTGTGNLNITGAEYSLKNGLAQVYFFNPVEAYLLSFSTNETALEYKPAVSQGPLLPRFRPAFGLRARLLYLIISCGVFSAL
jgi:hypothetical protein